MSEYKLWLNWEAFEIAAVSPLFPAEISLEKIASFAGLFEDLRKEITFKEWKEATAKLFKLTPDQQLFIYQSLEAFLIHDPHVILYRSTITEFENVPPVLKVLDVLCYLFLIFIKKKYRNLSEVSSLEQFPSKKEPERLSPRQRVFSSSTPTVGARLAIQTNKSDNSQFSLMLHFFNTKLPQFLNILCPNGVTAAELDALSFLVCGGPSYTTSVRYLSKLVGMEGLSPAKLAFHITSLLAPKDNDLFANKMDAPPTSPVNYRPALLMRDLGSQSPRQRGQVDKPILITDVNDAQKIETPLTCPSAHIHNCKHLRIYFCGVMSSIFISHCKDSIVFIGAAASAIRMEYCANVTVVASTRFIHLDACTRCSVYILTNNRPLITGNCTKISLAPYNALYSKLPADLLCAGINPNNNRWKEPMVIGSLGQTSAMIMPPQQFNLFQVPFYWVRQTIAISPTLPQEYADALEEKKRTLIALRDNLERIRAIQPDLADKIADQIKSTSSKWIQDEGHFEEISWMYSIEQ